jgi:hypothetical protein
MTVIMKITLLCDLTQHSLVGIPNISEEDTASILYPKDEAAGY